VLRTTLSLFGDPGSNAVVACYNARIEQERQPFGAGRFRAAEELLQC
jgi:hypothetical protein